MNIGHIINTGKEFRINTPKFLKTHSFITAITGAGKSSLILKMVEEMRTEEFHKKFGYIPITLLDDAGEFLKIPEVYNDFVVLNSKNYSDFLTADDAFLLGKRTRELEVSLIIKVKDLGSEEEQGRFIGQFVKGLWGIDREHWKPYVLFIDEADIHAPTKRGKVASKQPIIDACKYARKTNLAIILATQFASDVHIDARRQASNRIIGKTVELADRKVVSEMLGDKSLVDKFWGLGAGEFYMRGDALCDSLLRVQVHQSKIGTPDVGVKTIVQDNKTVGDVLRVAMKHSATQPFVIEQQQRITQLEQMLEDSKKNELTPDKERDIYKWGFEKGKQEVENSLKFKFFGRKRELR